MAAIKGIANKVGKFMLCHLAKVVHEEKWKIFWCLKSPNQWVKLVQFVSVFTRPVGIIMKTNKN